MKRKALETRLRTALRSVIVDEWSIFVARTPERPVSEVAICAQLARYLAPQLSRAWDVDCEYNRAGPDAIKLDLNGNRRPADLIVHRRMGCGKHGHNLLIVELKITSASENRGGTEESLQSLVKAHHYMHGVYLHLGWNDDGPDLQPKWRWFGDESDSERRDVFEPKTLGNILTEARSEWKIRSQRLECQSDCWNEEMVSDANLGR